MEFKCVVLSPKGVWGGERGQSYLSWTHTERNDGRSSADDASGGNVQAPPTHTFVSNGNRVRFCRSWRMDSLTEREMAQIARQQRETGVPRLSRHFSWPEFGDERRCFHQDFVYDVAMFAAARGFPWPGVTWAAAVAKSIFPQLNGPDLPGILSLLRDTLSAECLPNLTPVHRHEFAQFLVDACVARRRLFQAAVSGAADTSITRLHLEVQLPPTLCPLAEGTDLHEWEHQRHQAELMSVL